MMSPSIQFYLREQTACAHQALDALVGPIATRDGYRAFVQASFAHRSAVEAHLDAVAWPAAFAGWAPTRIVPLIARDLADLGVAPPAVEPLSVSQDIASAIGVAYVMEGSALGARLIARMAGELGFDAAHGARHLAGQERGLAGWRAFLAMVEAQDWIDRETAAAAARATFEHATRSMTSTGFA